MLFICISTTSALDNIQPGTQSLFLYEGLSSTVQTYWYYKCDQVSYIFPAQISKILQRERNQPLEHLQKETVHSIVHWYKETKQTLVTSRNIIAYHHTMCTVCIINIPLLRHRSTSMQLLSLLFSSYLQKLMTPWLHLLLLMSIATVNF